MAIGRTFLNRIKTTFSSHYLTEVDLHILAHIVVIVVQAV